MKYDLAMKRIWNWLSYNWILYILTIIGVALMPIVVAILYVKFLAPGWENTTILEILGY